MQLNSWWLDLKLGVRMLFKYPGLALAGGFGIAVGVAIAAGGLSFILANYMASSLPLAESERLVSIEMWDSAASSPARRMLHDYHAWRNELKSISELGAFRTLTLNLVAQGGAQLESVRVASMTASGFPIARVAPILGRHLSPDDEREGAPAVVVIGESIWRARFAGDPGILGRTIQLGTASYSVIGVMPEGFAFPVNHRIWIPFRTAKAAVSDPLTGPDVSVFGRLAPGATLESAQAELDTVGRRTASAMPKIYAQLQPRVMPYPHPFLGLHEEQDLMGVFAMQGIVMSLLGLACLNVAILVYSRTATRQAEISVRSALGASRGRIIAQLFIEALVLSGASATAGIVIAWLSFRQLTTATLRIAPELPFWMSFRLVPEAVWYAALLGVFAAAIVGVVPALKATRRDVQADLRTIGTAGSGMRLGKTWTVLIVAQVGFVVAILPAAVSSVWEETKAGIAGPGFAADEFLSAQLGMDPVSGANAEAARRYAVRHAELIRRLEVEPQITRATFAMVIPGDEPGASVETDDAQPSVHAARFNRVDTNYFRAFDVPILAGRSFTAADTNTAFVVVSQSLAKQVFGGNALGRRVRYASPSRGSLAQNLEPRRWYEIIGIVSDFPASGVSPGMDEPKLLVYHPAAPGQLQPATLMLRVRSGPSAFGNRLREIAASVDPDLYLRRIMSLEEDLRREQWISRLQAAVIAGMTVSVLLLSAAGIYALMSLTVSQRRREIGIRTALGADRTRLIASIFSRAILQLSIGAGFGMLVAFALERELGVLRDHSPIVVLPAVALLMITVGLLAALGPARRSLRIQPTEALREQ